MCYASFTLALGTTWVSFWDASSTVIFCKEDITFMVG